MQAIFNVIQNGYSSNFTLKKVHAITVNKVHGSHKSIENLRSQWPEAQIESMEGAAVFLACKKMSLPCLQFRAISNRVEPRNRDQWQIPLALKNLTDFLASMINNGFEIAS